MLQISINYELITPFPPSGFRRLWVLQEGGEFYFNLGVINGISLQAIPLTDTMIII